MQLSESTINTIKAALVSLRSANPATKVAIDAALAELKAAPVAEWEPVEDGTHLQHDAVSVSDNGAMLAIDSAYGIGHKRGAMVPLPENVRLCRQRPGSAARGE